MASLTSQNTAIYLGFRHGIKIKKLPSSSNVVSASQFAAPAISTSSSTTNKVLFRRSGNYPPVNWDFVYVQSLNNGFPGARDVDRCNMLKEKVRGMLDEEGAEALNQLELIDDLQRLGVCYHFKNRIKSILGALHEQNNMGIVPNGEDLYATALGFRLMRQHGLFVSQEVFDRFKDEKGNFKANLCKDTKGMLQLYEASYLLTEHESTLESAREFAAKHLRINLDHHDLGILDPEVASLLQHALKIPLHWRPPRVEARWFIDLYENTRSNKNPILLEFAKLDFNILQAIHQNDLKFASRWWESTCLGSKLTFARDRLVENFFWTIGLNFEPEFGYFRRMSTKVNALITTIDDIYDVYGTLDELELFTSAVERWDVAAMDDLPNYMKLCYLALQNAINEMAYVAMKEQGAHIIPYLRKAWAEICKTYMQEAKWYHSGYIPSLQEYMDNAWISISAPVILVQAYFFVSNPVTKEALECMNPPYHNIIRYSAMILRLADDLGTSSEEQNRGDVPKSIECCMNEMGVSKEEAGEYIRFLIFEIWKKLNKELMENHSPFSNTFVKIAVNLGRMAQCMYEHGDGHGLSNPQTKDRIVSLLFEPIAVSQD